jgi:hypothetical protein
MSEYIVIVPPNDPATVEAELVAWLEANADVRDRLRDTDLILDAIRTNDGRSKHRYRIPRAVLEGPSS